ncbi:RluA family pseudouridine synthase [Planctomycetota bacterium]|nr:RluA family pseudouridine synthase [Planctomycetota bacterium]
MASSDLKQYQFIVGADNAKYRLDRFLGERLGLSRTQVKRLLASSNVKLNKRVAKEKSKGLLVCQGDSVEVSVENYLDDEGRFEERICAESNALEPLLVHSSDGIVVVSKPAGMPVHPLKHDEVGTVLNSIAAKYPEVQGVGEGGLRSGVVHRLDVTTSGILLVALTQKAWSKYRGAFANHHTEKIYYALVSGVIEKPSELKAYLKITTHKPAKVSVVDVADSNSRWCDLKYEVVESFPMATLLKIKLGTGFLHQIRAMLSYYGHPLLGDTLYGGEAIIYLDKNPIEVQRPMLHAYSIKVDRINVQAEIPSDMQFLLQSLKQWNQTKGVG